MYRSSFNKCLQMMAYQFRAGNYERLAIVCHPAAKYYALLTPDELTAWFEQVANHLNHITCNLSIGELNSFMSTTQTDLFGQKTPDGD